MWHTMRVLAFIIYFSFTKAIHSSNISISLIREETLGVILLTVLDTILNQPKSMSTHKQGIQQIT